MKLSTLWKITTFFHVLLGFLLGLVNSIGIVLARTYPSLGLYMSITAVIGALWYISFELQEHDQTKFKDVIICFLVPFTITSLVFPFLLGTVF